MKIINGAWGFGVLLCLLVSPIYMPEALCQDVAGAKNMLATVEDVLADAGELKLTATSQGTKTYTANSDCEVTIKSCLYTQGASELNVQLNGEEIISWNRQSHSDSAKLIVKGEEVAESNIEGNPGDFTPQPQETKISIKKGDKLTLSLSGSFGKYEGYLSLVAPGIPKSENGAGQANKPSANTGDTSAQDTASSEGFSRKETFSSTGVAQAHRGGGTTFRVKKKGQAFGKTFKVVFSNGWSVIVPDSSKRFTKDKFIYRPGGSNKNGDTWTSHGGAFICANAGNTSKSLTIFY
ncbi:MAG: hypothetical protein KKB51_19470 [Candidatus Riflebacteria bacterium]|nr:hypothetical protein [Candidatus Riflebacteria bacterium]